MQCECPECVMKRDEASDDILRRRQAELYASMMYVPPISIVEVDGKYIISTADRVLIDDKYPVPSVVSPQSVSAIWGTVMTEPEPEPIAPPPINWLTHQKPLTDTVAERAAFLKKEGLACPTVIEPDDIKAISRSRVW